MEFLVIYIREAHPGSILSLPTEDGGTMLQLLPQTSTVADRLRNLRQFLSLTQISMPALIDDEDDGVKRAYAAWPDRIYAIDASGRVSFQGAPGPTGFKVPDLEAWLRENAKYPCRMSADWWKEKQHHHGLDQDGATCRSR